MRILITGGCGFIGRHLCRALAAEGHDLTVIDSLEDQVHGVVPVQEIVSGMPSVLPDGSRLCFGRVGWNPVLTDAHDGRPFDVVYHLAALVGVGQAQYEPDRYHDYNTGDTARLLRFWIDRPDLRPKRLVVAGSMSVYGEAMSHTPERDVLVPSASRENDRPKVPNVYARTKLMQELDCLDFGYCYGVPTMALRFFNVYGPDQSLSNPYTGVAAIFAACLLAGRSPLIYEDGNQSRDFVHVSDVVRALVAAGVSDAKGTVNVGTGQATTLLQLYATLAASLGRQDIAPTVTGRARAGDIRHCFADTLRAREVLKFEASVGLIEGMARYAEWLRTQDTSAIVARQETAHGELLAKGLLSK